MKIILKSFFFLFCITLISCNLEVEINVVSGNDGLNPKITDMTLADYGFVPYGQTIYSQVRIANPITGCSSIETNETDFYSQIVLMVRGIDQSLIQQFDKGDCTFLQKTKQAELSGAKLLIIIDNRKEDEDEIVMVADHSSVAHIPTIMINQKDGQALLDATKKESVILSVTFPKPEEQSIAQVDFWLDSLDKSSYEFLIFAQLNSSLSQLLSTKQVIFTPHYVIWYCAHCQESGYTLNNKDWPELSDYCIYKGRYCNPDPDRTEISDGPITGVNVVEEDWRQICIYETYKEQVLTNFQDSTWIAYMIHFYKNCIITPVDNLEKCSEQVMEIVGIDKRTIKTCQNQNVQNPDKDNSIVTNLEEQKNKFIQEEIMIWPSLFINNLTYRGELESNETINTICQALKSESKPVQCNAYNKYSELQKVPNHKSLSWEIVFTVLLCVALFMIVFYYLYQRQIRKEVDKEIQIQVNSSIAQYFALQEQKK